jgi:clathrin heavy chain
LRFFCETSEKECFCATLFTCFSHISPDIALELGWLNGYHHFIMPFLIQTFRKTHLRLKELETRTAPPKEEDNAQNEIAATYGNLGGFGSGVLMLENGGMGGGIPGGIPMGMVNSGIDMSGFAVGGPPQGGMPHMMPNGGMSYGGMM